MVNGGLTLQVWLPATNQTLHSIIVSRWNFIVTSQFYDKIDFLNWTPHTTGVSATLFNINLTLVNVFDQGDHSTRNYSEKN